MLKIHVRAIGYGTSWTQYPVEFEFTLNGSEENWEEGEIDRKILSKTRDKTACTSVKINSVEIEEI